MGNKKDFTKMLAEDTTAETTKALLNDTPTPKESKGDITKYCLRLPSELLEDYKALAFLKKETISKLVIEALSEYAEKPNNRDTLKQLKK
jgi:hypothetical protein